MNPDTWERIKDIYLACLEVPPEERERFIENASEGDEQVRAEALEMLRKSAKDSHFLDRSALHMDSSGSSTPVSPFAVSGQLISDRFRIEQLIARGGMGEIYRATDIELNRTVALKTVPSSSFLSQELRTRLRQEAQLVSKLNHSGICTLYDVRQHEGIDYLIMEFIAGETLGERLSRGPLDTQQAIDINLQVLAALEYAHREGVIHRDIKPANIMLTKGGPKLLDFGIAKFTHYQALPDDSPAGAPLTRTGFSIGTPPFMAPEQHHGLADARTDIYAFGVTFAAMLGTQIVSSLEKQFDISQIKEPLRQIITKCVKDDPSERWQNAGDLKSTLEMIHQESSRQKPELKTSRPITAAAIAMTAILIIAVSSVLVLVRTSPPNLPLEFQIFPPSGSQFLTIEQAGPPSISPDGASLAFVARDQSGQQKLWLRRMASVSALPLPGTEGATHPFWSPDSQSIGFFARNKLMTIEIAHGLVKTICDAHDGRGGAWGQDVIVFSPGFTNPLFRVSASGGVPIPITSLDLGREENSHRWPSFLPDHKHILFVVRAITPENSGLYAVSLDGGKPKRIDRIESGAVYAPTKQRGPGNLIYMRGSQIIAQPFNVEKLEFAGEPATITDLGFIDTSTTRLPVSISDTDVLTYGGGQATSSQVTWYDSAGKEVSHLSYPGVVRFLRLSPDINTVAMEKLDFRFGSGSLWFLGTEKPVSSRFTFDPISAYTPVWSPDGKSVAYTVHTGNSFELTVGSIDGSSRRVLLTTPQSAPNEPTDWTKDGFIVYEIKNPNTGWDLRRISVERSELNSPVLNSPADERQARLSPDGTWMAYTSNENGAQQVYVTQFPPSGPHLQVSTAGGSQPVWGLGSREVFFIDAERMLRRSPIDFRLRRAGTPTSLFQFPPPADPGIMDGWEYDVAADTERFITGSPAPLQESRPVTVISPWTPSAH
jgi:serine/threonine protein kinase